MRVSAGPKINIDGLVFAFDANNTKTYDDIPGITDHGISDWYCFENGTATYSAIYPNTEIIEINGSTGSEVGIVTTGSDPQRGTFNVYAGNRYYGTKAIHILDGSNNGQHKIAPVSFAGTYFANRHVRNEPQKVKIYAPQDDITVNVYQAYKNSGGVTGTATSTFTISRGEDYEYQYVGAAEFGFASGGTGDYQVGETVNFEFIGNNGNFPVSATVVAWNNSTRRLKLDNVNPGFRYGAGNANLAGIAFTGATSGAEYTYDSSYNQKDSWTFFETDKPAIMTVIGGDAADAMVMQPATQYSYRRRQNQNRTINDTAPSNNSNQYVLYDTSLPVVAIEIADGAGGDATQGIGYEYLSDTYSWGDVLSDFTLVSPYANNTVNVSFWENGQWNLGGSYSLNGTQTEPAGVFRTGNGGFDSAATGSLQYSGTHSNFNTSTLWKFEGTSPFSVIINDNSDDEERLLGWMSNNHLRTSSNDTQSFVNLIQPDKRKRMKIYGKRLTTSSSYANLRLNKSDYIEFDGVDDAIFIPSNFDNPQRFSAEAWVYPTELNIDNNNNYRKLILAYGASTNSLFIVIEQDGDIRFRVPGSSDTTGLSYSGFSGINQWGHIICTYDQSTAAGYFNGDLISTKSDASATIDFGSHLRIAVPNESSGPNTFKGRIAGVKIYDRALTSSEVKQNFNSHRKRFGI